MTHAPLKYRKPPVASSDKRPRSQGSRRMSTKSLRAANPIIGSLSDPAEHEATRVATRAVAQLPQFPMGSLAVPPRPRQRRDHWHTPGQCTSEHPCAAIPRTEHVEAKFFHRLHQEQTHGGGPLPPTLRAPLERALYSDLSNVQIHANQHAATLARDIHSEAFTLGDDVFFGHGALRLHTTDGLSLLAHELTHVIQGRGSSKSILRRSPSSRRNEVNSKHFKMGDIISGKEFAALVKHPRNLDPHLIAMRISLDSDAHLIIPRVALEDEARPPLADESHGVFSLKNTLTGQLWGSKLEEAADNQRNAHAAGRISTSNKMIGAFGVMGLASTAGILVGGWAGALATRSGAGNFLAGLYAGSYGGMVDGGLNGAGLHLVDRGSIDATILRPAATGVLYGAGIGATFGGLGSVAAPYLRARYFGGAERAAVATELKESGYTLWKPTLESRSARAGMRPDIPISRVAPPEKYVLIGPYRQTKELTHQDVPLQGHKLHVSATLSNASEVAQVVLPDLLRRGIPHKVVESVSEYGRFLRGGQAGKLITVYPRNASEAMAIRDVLDRRLRNTGLKDFVRVATEASVGTSGGVWTRYGANFRVEAEIDGVTELVIFKTNQLGQAIDRVGRPLLYRGEPLVLDERLIVSTSQFAEIKEFLKLHGVIVKDPRGVLIRPPWAPSLESQVHRDALRRTSEQTRSSHPSSQKTKKIRTLEQ